MELEPNERLVRRVCRNGGRKGRGSHATPKGLRHGFGVATALAGAAVTGASGYLGGHLTMARKVGSRDAAFGLDEVGPPAGPDAGTSPVHGPGSSRS